MRALAALAALALIGAEAPPDYAGDARALDRLLVENYAYLDRLPGEVLPETPQLAAERTAVHDRDSLLHYAEDRLTTLADHHAITGASFADDWALVPSYADLWIEGDRITAVRADSPAAAAGVTAGERLVAIDGVPLAAAVVAFWARLGLAATGERRDYAARVLAAGRRDRPRRLTIARGGVEQTLVLPSLYATRRDEPAVATAKRRGTTVLLIGNSLGDNATIAVFDAAMAAVPPNAPVELDVTDTPSGGNTVVARAIMGWFVSRPTNYQLHNSPADERATGIARQWIEQVLPRPGKHHAGQLTVRVGRWTGSMGEGLAIGLRAAGARLCGGPMAGLLGAIEDVRLPTSGLVVKFPTERLSTVDGMPRERFVAAPCARAPRQP